MKTPQVPEIFKKQIFIIIVICLSVIVLIAFIFIGNWYLSSTKKSSAKEKIVYLTDSQLPTVDEIIKANDIYTLGTQMESIKGVARSSLIGPVPLMIFTDKTTFYQITVDYEFGPKLNTVCGSDMWKFRATNNVELNKIITNYYFDGSDFLVSQQSYYSDNVLASENYYQELSRDGAIKLKTTDYYGGKYAITRNIKSNLFSIHRIDEDLSKINSDFNGLEYQIIVQNYKEPYMGHDYFIMKYGYNFQCGESGDSVNYLFKIYLDDNSKCKRFEVYKDNYSADNLIYGYSYNLTTELLSKDEANANLSFSHNIPEYDSDSKTTEIYGSKQDVGTFNKYISDFSPNILVPAGDFHLMGLNFTPSEVYSDYKFGIYDRNYYAPGIYGDFEYNANLVNVKNTKTQIYDLSFFSYGTSSDEGINIYTFSKELTDQEVLNGVGIGNTDGIPNASDININVNGSLVGAKYYTVNQISYSNDEKAITTSTYLIYRGDSANYVVIYSVGPKNSSNYSVIKFKIVNTSTGLNRKTLDSYLTFYKNNINVR